VRRFNGEDDDMDAVAFTRWYRDSNQVQPPMAQQGAGSSLVIRSWMLTRKRPGAHGLPAVVPWRHLPDHRNVACGRRYKTRRVLVTKRFQILGNRCQDFFNVLFVFVVVSSSSSSGNDIHTIATVRYRRLVEHTKRSHLDDE
jgi:hypothetical protein